MSKETGGFHYLFILKDFKTLGLKFLKNCNSERLAMDDPSKCQRHLGDVKKSDFFYAFRNLKPLFKKSEATF
jgi:hypothetical protein